MLNGDQSIVSLLLVFVVQYGANSKAIDHEGHSAVYYARGAGAMECVELLRSQGCPENPTLPRRRISNPPPANSTGGGSGRSGNSGPETDEIFERLPASVI